MHHQITSNYGASIAIQIRSHQIRETVCFFSDSIFVPDSIELNIFLMMQYKVLKWRANRRRPLWSVTKKKGPTKFLVIKTPQNISNPNRTFSGVRYPFKNYCGILQLLKETAKGNLKEPQTSIQKKGMSPRFWTCTKWSDISSKHFLRGHVSSDYGKRTVWKNTSCAFEWTPFWWRKIRIIRRENESTKLQKLLAAPKLGDLKFVLLLEAHLLFKITLYIRLRLLHAPAPYNAVTPITTTDIHITTFIPNIVQNKRRNKITAQETQYLPDFWCNLATICYNLYRILYVLKLQTLVSFISRSLGVRWNLEMTHLKCCWEIFQMRPSRMSTDTYLPRYRPNKNAAFITILRYRQ